MAASLWAGGYHICVMNDEQNQPTHFNASIFSMSPVGPFHVCIFYLRNVFGFIVLCVLPSSGMELVSAVALLLLFLLNLLLIGRQERLKSSEMVRRLKNIISKLDGGSILTLDPESAPKAYPNPDFTPGPDPKPGPQGVGFTKHNKNIALPNDTHTPGYIENINPFVSSLSLPSSRGGRGFVLASRSLSRPVHTLVPSLVPPLDLPGLPAGQPAG